MTEYDEYNYCLSQIDMLKEKLRNMGFVYDEQHGWYNYYNRPLSNAQKNDIEDAKMKFKKYSEYSGQLRKKLGI